MTSQYDPMMDLAHLFVTGLTYRNDTHYWASRIAERLGLGEKDAAETVAAVLREALGIPAPVTYDPADEFSVMDAGYQTVRTVADRYGKLTEVGRVGDEVVVIMPPGIGALFYDPARFAALREALDRAAMRGTPLRPPGEAV